MDTDKHAIDGTYRLPLLVLFVSGAVWLVIASVFALIASLKFHQPNLLADCACFTYGRVRPAFTNSLLYGFCVQAALGFTLWFFGRLGNAPVVQPGLAALGASLWNLGVTVGVLGILAGDSTGFENFEMPRYAQVILFIASLSIGILAVLTLHQRRNRELVTAHWFLLAALFWFVWILSTAILLLLQFPVRGMAQAVIDWWYSNNLLVVWMGLVGLGAAFYFVPKLTGLSLHSRYLAVLTFWLLTLFGSWGGIPNSAPIPAWIPALSSAATVLMLIPVLAVTLNFYNTTSAWFPDAATPADNVYLRFISAGLIAFIVAALLNIESSLVWVGQITDLTWFTTAKNLLQSYGFFAMVMFGVIYCVVPRLMDGHDWRPGLVRAHFGLAVSGILLSVVPLAVAGIKQGFQLNDPKIPMTEIIRTTLMGQRISTLGDLLMAAGHCVFLYNLCGLVTRFVRSRASLAYAAVTTEIKPMTLQP